MNFSFLRKTIIGRHPAVSIFILIHALIFAFVFSSGFYADYEISAFGIFHEYASKIISGQVPYLDFAVEYPPLALLLMVVPGLIGEAYHVFSTAFIAEMVFFNLGIIVLLAMLSRRLGLTVWKTLAVYTLVLLAIGPIIMLRYDVAVAFFTLLAVYLLLDSRSRWAWVVLGLAVMAKLYAVVLVPLFLLWHWRQGQKRELVWGGVVFAAVIAAVSAVPLLVSAGGYMDSFMYHSDRPLQAESLYASVMLGAEQLGWLETDLFFSYGSVNIDAPGAEFFGSYYWLPAGAGLLLVYWLFDRFLVRGNENKAGGQDAARTLGLVAFSAAAVAVFIIFSKVLSPQFIIWLYPLVPLLWRGGPWSWIMLVLIGFMTAYVYPLNYIELQQGEALPTWVLLGRNVLLLGLVPVMLWSVRRRVRG